MRIHSMKKCLGNLYLVMKFQEDSRLFHLTNKLVSSVFKTTKETIFPRYCRGSQNPCLLHRESQNPCLLRKESQNPYLIHKEIQDPCLLHRDLNPREMN
jgi:hypothetical protein